jgi:hypothetical protein
MVLDAAVANIDRASSVARLAAYSRVDTTDVGEAAESIGRIFCPHALDPLRHSWPDFHALHNCAAFDGSRRTMWPMAVRYRSIRVVSTGSSCCRCRFTAGQRSGRPAAKWRPVPAGPPRCCHPRCRPNGLAGQLRATHLAGGPAPGRNQGRCTGREGCDPGRIRPAYRSRHAVWPRPAMPDRVPG